MIRIAEYVTAQGKSPFGEWLVKIPAAHAIRVTEALYRMEQGNLGDHKAVGEGVYERRIFGSPALRVYFAKDGKELVILLAGGGKNTQSKDIKRAQTLWARYKEEK